MINSKNILITGATGFVGANLVHCLVNGKNKIHIILRKTSDTWRINDILDKVSIHYVDLNNVQEVNKAVKKIKPEIIYHLAAYENYLEESRKNLETNIFGTLNLLEACNKVGYDVFINTGSSSEYGTKVEPMSEEDLIKPNSYYSIAKASQTLLCQHFAREKKMPIITLRLFSVYGPYEGSRRLIPTLINNCLKGKDLSLVLSKTARDFVFVDDVVEAYLKVAQLPKLAGNIFNIGTSKQFFLKDIVSLVIAMTNAKVKQNWGAMPSRSFDTNTWVADISKAKKMIGWKPKYNLKNGLEKTIDWFRNNNNLYK